MSVFKTARDEWATYADAVARMYNTETMMLHSDFGRTNPKRVHELARRAVGIPDHVVLGRTPLAEWMDDH